MTGKSNDSLKRIMAHQRLHLLLSAVIVFSTSATFADEAANHPKVQSSTSDQTSPDFSPSGHYLGPLEIPSIVRYQKLPMRVYLQPALKADPPVMTLDDRMIPLFERALREATEPEIQETAALSLARVAGEFGISIASSEQPLRELMKQTQSRRVRMACARAIAKGNIIAAGDELVDLLESADDSERLVLEPALARWRVQLAVPVWIKRISNASDTAVSLSLACDGLSQAESQEAVPHLTSLVQKTSVTFGSRAAAARALCKLDSSAARSVAEPRVTGSVQDRLISVTLLNHSNPSSHAMTEMLCDDPSSAVAAAAWLQLFRENPASLVGHLPSGRFHRDAVVRETAARVIRLSPDPERLLWLAELLGDEHIKVRNVAREMLFAVTSEKNELHDQIVALASGSLQPTSANWQRQEQCLILLGQLRATQFSDLCFSLLDSPQSEVRIAAAWLIHLFPDLAIKDSVLGRINVLEGKLKTEAPTDEVTVLELTHLFQYCGIIRAHEVAPLMMKHVPKGSPGGSDKRSAAIWTLGLLYEKSEPDDLVTQLNERVNDHGGGMIPPEDETVRRLSAVALGLMRSKSKTTEATMLKSFDLDPGESLIPGAARWTLFITGKAVPGELPPIQQFIGGWKLNPAGSP